MVKIRAFPDDLQLAADLLVHNFLKTYCTASGAAVFNYKLIASAIAISGVSLFNLKH